MMKKVIAVVASLGLIGIVAFLNFHIPVDVSNFDDTKIYKWEDKIKQLDPASQDDVFKASHNYLSNSNADTGNYNGNIRKAETESKNRLWLRVKIGKTYQAVTMPVPVVANRYLPDSTKDKPFTYKLFNDDEIKLLKEAVPTLSSIEAFTKGDVGKLKTVKEIDAAIKEVKKSVDGAKDDQQKELKANISVIQDKLYNFDFKGAFAELVKGAKSFNEWDKKTNEKYTQFGNEFVSNKKDGELKYIKTLMAKKAVIKDNAAIEKTLTSYNGYYAYVKRLLNKDFIEASKEGDELFPLFSDYEFLNKGSQNIPKASLGVSKQEWNKALKAVTGTSIDLDRDRCIIIRSGKFIAVYSNVKSWWVYKGNEGKYSKKFDAPPNESSEKPSQDDVLGYSNSSTKVILFKYRGKEDNFGVKEILQGGPISMHSAFK